MTTPAASPRCAGCGARVGWMDRACFACHAELPAHTPDGSARSTSDVAVPPLAIELRYGQIRQATVVRTSPSTVGSTDAADVCLAAGFLRPRHAQLTYESGGWILRALASGAVLMHGGQAHTEVAVVPGGTYRVGDAIGNFVTLRAHSDRSRPNRSKALHATLPDLGSSFLIGSDQTCAVRLDHPLVQRRHAALRRDESGWLWLEDRSTSAGTYVNGRRLRGRARLSLGDVVQVGPFSATVSADALEQVAQVPGVEIDVLAAGITVRQGGVEKRLLHEASLRIAPASLTALIGPSGAGKTTLMRMLAGQLAPTYGSVSYDGNNLLHSRQSYSDLMGFVPQDDVVHVDLTVDEALTYQAALRLGASRTPVERQHRVDELVTMLGLSAQSTQLVRSLSGGQRKRVSIACELLKEPQLLFLDEPTSGLDPGLDKRMMLLLRLLADQGRTILLTTHSITHISACDTLILVGPGGHVIYAGDPDEAVEWFGVASIGDVFALTETSEAAAAAAAQRAAHNPPPVAASTAPAPPSRPPVGSPAWRAAAVSHLRIFAERHVRLIRRDNAALAYTLIQGMAVAVITAFVAPSPFQWSVNSSSVAFVFGCAAVWFGMIGAVRELVKERPIWRREFMAGGNVLAYLCSKVVVLAGLALVQSLTMTIVLDLTLGLPAGGPLGSSFLTFTVTLWLANLCGIALGLLVSATAPSADRALSLVPYLLIAQLILSGVLFRLGGVAFVSWFMPARWAVSCLGGVAGLDAATLGQSSGMYPHSGVGLFGSWLVLALLATLAMAGTSWSLVRQGRSWQTGSDSAPPVLRAGINRIFGERGRTDV